MDLTTLKHTFDYRLPIEYRSEPTENYPIPLFTLPDGQEHQQRYLICVKHQLEFAGLCIQLTVRHIIRSPYSRSVLVR